MADYSARIKLIVDGVRQLTQVEAKVKELHRLMAGGWRVDIANNQQFKQLNANLDAAKQRAAGLGQALTDALGRITQTAKSLSAEAVKSYRAVAEAVRTAFDTVAVFAFGNAVDMTLDVVENYRQTLLSLVDTIGALRTRQARLRSALDNTNSSTETAVRIAGKLVEINQRLNAEQRAQNDLMREAAGLQPQAVRDAEFYRRKALLASRKVNEERLQALSDQRAAEQTASDAARARLAAEIKQRRDAIQAIQDETAAIRAREAAAKAAMGTPFAKQVVDPRGKSQYEFPIGPNPLSGRAFGVPDNLKATRSDAIDAAMIAAMRRRREKFYAWEATQPRKLYSAYDKNFFLPAIQGFQRLAKASANAGTQIAANLSKRLGGAAIGGAFPLLFGQGPQAAIGGVLGGLLLPGGGGFAGSLLGTLIGDLKSAQVEVERLSGAFGYTEIQSRSLASAFQLAGDDADNLRTALVNIRGLGITSEEEISLLRVATELSKDYGGKVDKVAQSLANTLEQGKVTITSITSLTSQGIPVQEKLAEKIGVNRQELFKMARDGKINVQDLIDVMVDMGLAAEKTADKSKSGFDRFTEASKTLGLAIAGLAETLLTILAPALERVLNLATRGLTAVNNLLSSNVTRQMGQAGLSFTTGAVEQGIDNVTGALKDLNAIVPSSTAEVDKLLLSLDDMTRNLQRTPADLAKPITDRATDVQGQVQAARSRLQALRRTLAGGEGPAGEAPITRINAPFQQQPTGGGGGDNGLQASLRRTAALKAQATTLLLAADIQDRITAAERIGAKELALSLERDRERAQILGKYEALIAKVRDTENKSNEIDALRQKRNAELVASQLDYEGKRTQLAVERKASGYEMQTQLQQEAFLMEQTLQGKGREAQLQVEIANAIKDLDPVLAGQVATQMRRNDALTQELKNARELEAVYADIASTIAQGMTQALKDVVKGTESLRDVAMNLLNNVLNKVIDIAMNMAMFGVASGTGTGGGLLGGLFNLGKTAPGRAAGGSVMGGSPYVVGEKGPELFVPGRSGTIVPNSSMGGGSTNVVVNVSAGGSNVEGDQQGAKQLGQAVAAAVQQELIKQKRPGGLLA